MATRGIIKLFILLTMCCSFIERSSAQNEIETSCTKVIFGKEPLNFKNCSREKQQYISRQDLYVECSDTLFIIDSMVVHFFHKRGSVETFHFRGCNLPTPIIEYLNDEKYVGGIIWFESLSFFIYNQYHSIKSDYSWRICKPSPKEFENAKFTDKTYPFDDSNDLHLVDSTFVDSVFINPDKNID